MSKRISHLDSLSERETSRQNTCKREGKHLLFQTCRGDSERERLWLVFSSLELLSPSQKLSEGTYPPSPPAGYLPTNRVFTTLNERLRFPGGLERKKER